MSENRLAGAMVFRHYSDYNDLYIPWGVALENQFAALTLDLSPRTSALLLQTGVDSAQLKTARSVPFRSVCSHARADVVPRALYRAENVCRNV